jgi:hypothetical protein
MSKSTPTIAIISIWLITLIAIAAICKTAGIQLLFVDKIPSWDWIKLLVELGALLFD